MGSPADSAMHALWHDLLSGERVVLETSRAGYELLVAPATAALRAANKGRYQACFEAVLRGKPQKAVARDLNVAPGTVAGMLRGAASGMGVVGPLSRLPPALPLLAHALGSPHLVSSCDLQGDLQAHQRCVLSVSAPDAALAAALSMAERAVAARFVGGKSYAEIARARGVSYRTIANQLASASAKLGATGRFDMLRALVERSAALGAPITVTLRVPASGDEAPLSYAS